jgi:hypothetical protein
MFWTEILVMVLDIGAITIYQSHSAGQLARQKQEDLPEHRLTRQMSWGFINDFFLKNQTTLMQIVFSFQTLKKSFSYSTILFTSSLPI